MEKLDETDAAILRLLQESGRLKRNELAEAVDLSVPAVSERMRKLEERGVISGYHAVLDAKRLLYDITAFIRVHVDGSPHYGGFVEAISEMDEVLELHSITGEGSHIIKIRTRNTASLEQLLARIQRVEGVRATQTSIVLTTHKETRNLVTAPMVLGPSSN
ncbi:Lrp/AsnC family transcriptional regulator [soil metagenome]